MGLYQRIPSKFKTLALFSILGIVLVPTYGLLSDNSISPEWGFFGHKRINRLAVFTLPQEMLVLYKPSIEYITEHAVDPDKRRYATKHEAVRHYIDIDQWGTHPFKGVPREFEGALMTFAEVRGITSSGDTIKAIWKDLPNGRRLDTKHKGLSKMRFVDFKEFFSREIMPQYYDGPYFLADGLNQFFGSNTFSSVVVYDRFSEHGILPYNLIDYQKKLTQAFEYQDVNRILRLSAEIGHYIGDAHVPLHTTTNYNGQLTDQLGIHGFWESRIPELFADESFDYFVGKAQLIENLPDFFWSMVLESHSLVDSVLNIEKRLSLSFPADRQYCFEDRNYINISQPCPEYAAAYSVAMEGMVEKRFRASIHAIGSSWYTAWYQAGQPDLSLIEDRSMVTVSDSLDQLKEGGRYYGRQHWD